MNDAPTGRTATIQEFSVLELGDELLARLGSTNVMTAREVHLLNELYRQLEIWVYEEPYDDR